MKNQKGFSTVIGLIIVGILILGGGGYYLVTRDKEELNTELNSAINTQAQNIQWKQYKGTTGSISYQIAYPSDWAVEKFLESVNFSPPGKKSLEGILLQVSNYVDLPPPPSGSMANNENNFPKYPIANHPIIRTLQTQTGEQILVQKAGVGAVALFGHRSPYSFELRTGYKYESKYDPIFDYMARSFRFSN